MRTQRIVKAGIWAAAACSALCAQAVTVINRTTGQLLFYDDFESAPFFGGIPDVLNQLFLTSGVNTTVYWVDDIEAEWVYTPPPPPPPPPTGTVSILN
jgi:hypothetical protein